MSEQTKWEKIRFLGSLEAVIAAWAVMGIMVTGALVLGRVEAFVLTLGGMAAILWLARSHPVYARIKHTHSS